MDDISRDESRKISQVNPAFYDALEENPQILVWEYLKIGKCMDIPFHKLELSTRAMNSLDRVVGPEGTVIDILKLPLETVVGMKAVGLKTINEILETVAHFARENDREICPEESEQLTVFFGLSSLVNYTDLIAREKWDEIETQLETEAAKEACRQIKDTSDVIGTEMVIAALTSSYPQTQLYPALVEFSTSLRIRSEREQEIRRLLNSIPDERRRLKVMPFLDAWPGQGRTAELNGLETEFDENTIFTDIQRIAPDLSADRYRKLVIFLTWCRTDIREAVDKITYSFRKDRQREIVELRAAGKTLEEIGAAYKLTRERVRQIEKRAFDDFPWSKAENILLFISADRQGDEILTAKKIREYAPERGDLFLYMLRYSEKPVRYRYAKALDAFIIGNAHVEEEHIRAFVDELPDLIPVDELQKHLSRAEQNRLPPELVELQIHADYFFKSSIQTWQRGKLSIRDMCRAVLPLYDPQGVRVNSPAALRGFREKLVQQFGTEARVSEGDHALAVIIADVGMLRARGTYVAVREHVLSEELLNSIRAYIDYGKADVYMYGTLYEEFKQDLQKAGVDNRYYLQGILRRELDQQYYFSRDCISRGEKMTNIYGAIEQYIRNNGGFVSGSELREAFPGVTEIVMSFALMQKNIISNCGEYIHADNLHIPQVYVAQLHKLMEKMTEDGYEHNAKELYQMVMDHDSHMLEEMEIKYQSALYNIVAYLFDDEYVFSRPWIARKGSEREKVVLEYRKRSMELGEDTEEVFVEIDDEDESETSFKGKLIDYALLVLQKTGHEMSVQEIGEVITKARLYQTNSRDASPSVYQAINNAINKKGSRNEVLGELIGSRMDTHGRKLYYLVDPDKPIFSESVRNMFEERLRKAEQRPDTQEKNT